MQLRRAASDATCRYHHGLRDWVMRKWCGARPWCYV